VGSLVVPRGARSNLLATRSEAGAAFKVLDRCWIGGFAGTARWLDFRRVITYKGRLFKMPRRRKQLALQLPERPRWGGRRSGAGRKPGDNPGLPHRSRPTFSSLPAHVTWKVRADVPSLRTARVVREVERSFSRGCARPGFRLVQYSLQNNHVHLVVEARTRVALGRGMMAIGARLARAVNRVSGRSGKVFADRYHSHVLRTPREVRAALRYVLLNARRHAKRLTKEIRLDPASSARWFDGWQRAALRRVAGPPGVPSSAAGARSAPVARARTWLLTTGWRRHGLLDPADVPG